MNEEDTPKYVVIDEVDKRTVDAENNKFLVAFRSSLESPEAIRLSSPSDHEVKSYQEMQTFALPQRVNSKNKKLYWSVGLPIFVAVVVLAVVLGVVLGLPHHPEESSLTSKPDNASNETGTSASPPPQPLRLTPLATAIGSDANNLLLYYQSQNGSIVEAVYDASKLSVNMGNLTATWNIIAVTADIPTVLAAAAWTDKYFPKLERRLLVFTNDGYVTQSNRTSTFAWTDQLTISNATIVSRTLSVCADPIIMQGARVYYGSAEGYIREIVYDTNTNRWYIWWSFVGSDPFTGTACTVQNTNSTNYINVYLRNSTTSQLVQKWWSFPEAPSVERDDMNEWPVNTSPYTLPTHANISALFDGTNTDIVIMASPNGTVDYGKAAPHGSQWLNTGGTSATGLDAPSVIAAEQVKGTASIVAVWQVDEIGSVWVFQDNDLRLRAVSMDGTVNVILV